jgi:predicted ATPase
MAITHVDVRKFGVFSRLSLQFAEGINVFIGANATGKSHLLKLLYSLHTTLEANSAGDLEGKLERVFRPDSIGRLVHRSAGRAKAEVEMSVSAEAKLSFTLSNLGRLTVVRPQQFEEAGRCVFMPTREVLALFEGFVALYEARELSFDETYYDTCKLLALPALRGPRAQTAARLMANIGDALGGGVSEEGGRFYVSRNEGGVTVDLEANLLSEGLRKVATLVRLIANGSLSNKSVLFWDEPEANMNPRLVRDMVRFLQSVAAQGVQVFVATHDTLLCQRLSLPAEMARKHRVPTKFFGLYRDHNDVVAVDEAETLDGIEHNAIFDEFVKFREEQQQELLGESA